LGGGGRCAGRRGFRCYSLFWHEGEDYRRYDWHPGCVFAPTDMIWHQHINTSAEPVR
jgi:hypothetical protein